jgi:hypothetical protein
MTAYDMYKFIKSLGLDFDTEEIKNAAKFSDAMRLKEML